MVMCGPWEPRLCVYGTPSWSQVDWLLCVSMVSDAVTMLVGKARHRQKSCLALVNFRSRAYLPWAHMPVTHTGF